VGRLVFEGGRGGARRRDRGYWLGGMPQKNRMKILFLPPF